MYGAREDYKLLERIGARRVEAKLDDLFLDPGAWTSLSVASLPSAKRRRTQH